MLKRILGVALVVVPFMVSAQEEAVTASGKTVLLFSDSTWKLKPLIAEITEATSLASDTSAVAYDSIVVAAKPDAPKQFTETSTGFKGFMKPELKLPNLPAMSDGVYQFRLKVNKQGMVKEVVTLQRGPNGETEIMIRNAITRMKFIWDNSIVPPLTEGVIKVTVPAVK